jgi:hypothetical protein
MNGFEGTWFIEVVAVRAQGEVQSEKQYRYIEVLISLLSKNARVCRTFATRSEARA